MNPSPVEPAADREFANPTYLRLWAGFVFAVAAGSALALGVTQSTPIPLLPLILLVGLAMAAEHFAVVMPNGASASVSVMVCLAAIVVFWEPAPLLGPLLVGMASGVFVPHLLHRDWMRLGLNVGMFGLATLSSAVVYGQLVTTPRPSIGLALFAAVLAAGAYWLTNIFILAVAMTLRRGTSLRTEFLDLWGWAEIEIVVFAVLGFFMGRLYLDLGAWSIVLFVSPLLAARQSFAAYLRGRESHQAVLATLIRALEAKDVYTAGHVERVARFASYIGTEFNFTPGRLRRLHDAALLHDIGKLTVPNQLLNKPGKLTPSEYERLKRHDDVTLQLVSEIDTLAPLADGVALGLDAPLESRIVHVADAFDAMTSTRPYRRALTQEEAVAELREHSGSQFDGECVEALVAALERKHERYGAGEEHSESTLFRSAPVAGVGSAGLGDLAPEPS